MTSSFDTAIDWRRFFAVLLIVGKLLFFLVGTNPYIDMTGLDAGDPAVERSSSLNQLVMLILFFGLILWGFTSPMRRLIMQPRVLIIMILLWFCFVSAVSPYPALSLKRLVLASFTLISASIFLFLPKDEAQFTRLLSYCVLICLGFAYFGVVFKPSLAIHQTAEILEPMLAGSWRGHFAHKNAAAGAMLLCVLFGLYCYSSGHKGTGLITIVAATFFLLKTGGKTSAAMLPVIYLLSVMFERWRWSRIPIAIGGVALFNFLAVGAAISEPIWDMIEGLGIDASFTNRSDIWRLAFSEISQRPWLGQGFLGFWQTRELLYSGGIETWAIAAFNGHNGYLDLILTVGLPGFLLCMIWILYLPLRYSFIIDHNKQGNPLSRLYIRIWLYGIYSACMESVFFANGSLLWFSMMLAIFGLRLQAKTVLISGDHLKPVPLRSNV